MPSNPVYVQPIKRWYINHWYKFIYDLSQEI